MATHSVSNVKVQLRRDTATNWSTENPTLLAGEIGIETDTLKAKVGDGSTAWNSLSYAFGISGGSGDYLPLSGGAMNGAITSRVGDFLKRNVDNSYMRISGGYDNTSSFLLLYGKNASSSAAGKFTLRATDGTDTKDLSGSPDGTLTWDGTAISLNGHTHSYLPLSGGTMTGTINSNTDSSIDATSSTRVEEFLSRGKDKNGLSLGNEFYSAYNVDVFHGLRTTNPNFNSGTNWADIRLHVSTDGKRYITTDYHSSLTDGTLDNSNHIPTTAFINSKYLSLEGGTMTGNVAISSSSPTFTTKDTSITRNTAPSVDVAHIPVQGIDSANNRTWGLYHRYTTDKTNRIDLIVYNGTTTNYNWTGIGVGFDGSGNAFTYAPTPATSSNDTSIATTAFVKSNLSDYLPLSGGTMTGAITASSTEFLKRNVDNSSIRVMGGTDYTKGAWIALVGKDNTSQAGQFIIRATDGTNTSTLTGTPSGTFTWNGTAISLNGHTHNYAGSSSAGGAATNATNVTSTKITYPSSATNYYVLASSSDATNTGGVSKFGVGFRMQVQAGTTSVEGKNELILGNSTATGTAGNQTGLLTLYNDSGKYHVIRPHSGDTSNRTVYTPKSGGTLVCHTTDTAIGSASSPVYVTASGVATACTSLDASKLTGTVPSGCYTNTNNISASSVAANGYTKFNNGMIIQWGSKTSTTGSFSVTFPTAFTSACYSVVAVGGSNTSAASNVSASKTSFTCQAYYGGDNGSATIYWVAIGK